MGAVHAKGGSEKPSNQFPFPTPEGGTFDVKLDHIPARVDIVNLDGLKRTKDDYVTSTIESIFKVTNFEELVYKTTEVQRQLERLGCFRRVGILIDTNKAPGASPDSYEITFMATELGRFVGSVNTIVGANDGSLVFGIKMPNLLGRGDRISVDHSIGSRESRNTSLSYTKPIPGPWNVELSASLIHQRLKNILSNYGMSNSGGILDLKFETAQGVKHSMQWEGGWRVLEASSRKTSMAVREQSGDSFKSALRHILSVDHRDSTIFPTSGVLLKLVQEYAGLGGDVAYVKHDSDLQVNFPLPFDMVLQGGFRLGVLRPLDTKMRTHNIHDLFFLGGPCGPQTLRGFEMKSVGSRSGKDCLGGQAYWSSALHLYAPLPFGFGAGSFGDYFRSHLFVNAGNITDHSFNTEDFAESFQSLLTNFRASCGIGLTFRIGESARVELNYCWPLRFCKGDRLVRGVQFGVGLEFL